MVRGFCLLAGGSDHDVRRCEGAESSQEPNPTTLKSLSLEELSQIEVTTPSKTPVKAFQTAAAIFT